MLLTALVAPGTVSGVVDVWSGHSSFSMLQLLPHSFPLLQCVLLSRGCREISASAPGVPPPSPSLPLVFTLMFPTIFPSSDCPASLPLNMFSPVPHDLFWGAQLCPLGWCWRWLEPAVSSTDRLPSTFYRGHPFSTHHQHMGTCIGCGPVHYWVMWRLQAVLQKEEQLKGCRTQIHFSCVLTRFRAGSYLWSGDPYLQNLFLQGH